MAPILKVCVFFGLATNHFGGLLSVGRRQVVVLVVVVVVVGGEFS